ncbi:MAG: OmpA family protein [Acidobacteriia bacterium]|nr:OmpA family protein [Terriglobia bacterium]
MRLGSACFSLALLLGGMAAQAAPQAAGQPDLTAVKADFVPGEKVIFYDDFTDMTGDEPPPHWKVRGGAVTLKVGGGVRQLTATDRTELTPNLKGIPKNFTLETEVKFDNPGDLRSVWSFHPKDGGEEGLYVWTQTHGTGLVVHLKTLHDEIGEAEPEPDFSKPIKMALWVQNGRVRFYVNGQRVVDANQVDLPPLDTAMLLAELYGDNSAIGYRMVRLAESTPDFSQVISSTGRYVTHGILFDTDSDRIKTESAAVIKSIARGLETNPTLKLRIDGHTDATGAAEHNLDLSKRRAEAVKAVLVAQFHVAADRLTASGLGAGKPVDSNDTPQGRAQNRRVEFVKQ